MRLVFVPLTALLLLGACSNGPDPTSSSPSGAEAGGREGSGDVTAIDNEFDPTELKLTAGEEVTVTFTNNGETVHTFTSEELGFDTGNVEPGASADVTFTAPEEDTPFVCTIHEGSDGMTGTITSDQA